MFASLAYREFRLLWLGQVGQASASFGERVTRSWLALDLTGSAFQLGTLELTRGVASLVLGMWGGVLADRFDKRLLLMIIQVWTLGFYAVMAWLTFSGGLRQGAAAYGALYSCAGLGALLGGLAVASAGVVQRRGRLLLTAGALNGIAMLGMGAVGLLSTVWPRFILAVPLLMLAGGSQTSFRAASNGLLLAATPRTCAGAS